MARASVSPTFLNAGWRSSSRLNHRAFVGVLVDLQRARLRAIAFSRSEAKSAPLTFETAVTASLG